MDSNTLQVPQYKQRLFAREQKLQRQAEESIQQLKRKQLYFKNNGKELISNEVVDRVSASNPLVGKIANKILGGSKKAQKQKKPLRKSSDILESKSVLNRFSRMGSALIPMLYTIGQRKLLSYSFKGAGKLIRFTLKNLFGGKRKRRRR